MHKKTSVIMASAVAVILTVSVLAFALPNQAYALKQAAPQSGTTVVIAGGDGGTGGAGGAGGTGGDGGIAVANTGGIGSGSGGTGSAHASANGGDANGGNGGNANGGSVHISFSIPRTAKA